MTKKIRAAFLLCLTLCIAAFAIVFAACADNGEESLPAGTYQVTVQYEDGTAATDLDVQLCRIDENGNEGLCLTPVAVDENGVATVVDNGYVDGQQYHIKVADNTVPDGYVCEPATTVSGQSYYTIVLKAA